MFSALGKKNDVPLTAGTLVFVAVGFIASLAFNATVSSFAWPGFGLLPLLTWLGVSNFILSVFIWIKLLKRVEAVKAATLSLLTPFSSLLFIKLLLPQTDINAWHFAGLLLILAGVGWQGRK
jgi:drug/metabolite transporter (DMT)-like permease